MHFIGLLFVISTSVALNFQETHPRARIIHVNKELSKEDPEKPAPAPWTPITRGQFMRDILFGIHPDSPLNRDIWIKSGFIKPEEPSHPQLRALKGPIQFMRTRPLNLATNEGKPKSPLRRKVPPVSLKRFPKIVELDDIPVKANLSQPTVAVAVNKSVDNPLAPVPQSKPVSVPVVTPTIQNEVTKVPRCFLQKPLPVVYYLLPVAQNPGYSPNQELFSKPYPSLFDTGFYAPIQNRLPFPPRPPPPVVYLQPVPYDLLAMEGNEEEQEIKQKPLTTTTTVPIVPTPSSTEAPSSPKPVTIEKLHKPVSGPEITDIEFRKETIPILPVDELTEDSNNIKVVNAKDDITEDRNNATVVAPDDKIISLNVKEEASGNNEALIEVPSVVMLNSDETGDPKSVIEVKEETDQVPNEVVEDNEDINPLPLSVNPDNSTVAVVTRVEESHSQQ